MLNFELPKKELDKHIVKVIYPLFLQATTLLI
jgi:hypothetical protein